WLRRDANGARGSSAADNKGNLAAVTNAQLYQAYPKLRWLSVAAVNNHNDTTFRRRGTVTHDYSRVAARDQRKRNRNRWKRTESSLDGARVSASIAWSVFYLLTISRAVGSLVGLLGPSRLDSLDHKSLFEWIGICPHFRWKNIKSKLN
ncbi:hypothetical protein ALC62_00226, partial [Cyphomyrmex costatus]